jgi:hypothetical protein
MRRPDEYLLLTRDGCGLCEEFEQALRTQRPEWQITLADVDSREDWRRRYGLRVPVLLDQWDEVIAEGHFDPAAAP